MKHFKTAHNLLLKAAKAFAIFTGLTAMLAACNSSKEDEPPYEPALSVAVQGFSLNPNAKVMENLDSVFFSIDLNHRVIFNADSLPVGTAVSRLVPKITFPSAVEKAEILMEGGTLRTGTVDYKKNPTDSIDFTGKVTLTLSTGGDQPLTQSYDIKVNVHRMVADSLMWDKSAVMTLPSAKGRPAAQKTVADGKNSAVCLVQESDGSYSLGRTADLPGGRWSVESVSLPFIPQVRSLTSLSPSDGTATRFFILSDTGLLMTSTDWTSWTQAASGWHTVIGAFGDTLLGISDDNGIHRHAAWPEPPGFQSTQIPANFPTEGISNFNTFSSEWSSEPIGLFAGGKRGSQVSNATWAYDGSQWAEISNRPLPAMSGVLVVPYFSYRQTATSWIQTEFSVLLALGGIKADGSLNRKVYLSYDNGVNWMEAQSLLQLPAYVPSFSGADALVATSPMNADIGAHWKTEASLDAGAQRRVQYFVDGSDVNWECPFIYVFGGTGADGSLHDTIWRAVLARLTFVPVF